jgi:predicted CDP-diglyceride synthetase/phosphatidate cytidylyltransferase
MRFSGTTVYSYVFLFIVWALIADEKNYLRKQIEIEIEIEFKVYCFVAFSSQTTKI